ncbi:PstS family phosphate ABC transporter substrate-binding protein [Streptomyces koyangensis]|uniref:Phosphate ABC transporter substrate-binding protein n=1 Tax=Streptomyces koyangensis TaxID=188770 RepID=A0ABX7EEZ7_9ACTN|nr:substrate-binding domain-containing protein [Streptomyces koyangensis]QRF03218.1 phosphate ABC transporter substrate-binding protein [Streptomyces koyangensis]
MEWVNTENVIAVGTFAVASSIAFGQWWYERMVPRRRRIGYRVQLDTAIGDDDGTGGGNTRLGLFDEADGMDEASVVLLRIENDGALSVSAGDYTSGGLHGMTATFDGREVHGVAVTVGPGSGALMSHFTPAHGLEYSGSSLRIPRVPLNKGAYFKLLVLLSGGTVGSQVTVSGGVQDGDVHPNESLTPDEKPPVFSRPARLTSMAFLVGIALPAGLIVTGGERPPPMGCATGSLEVTGSTAFAPVAEELAEAYMEQCPGSRITVAAHGSTTGLRELAVLVGRGAASGPRDVLQRRLLDGAFEPPASSRDCSRKDNPKASVIRCELDTTDQVIATVARTPGALGYSELRTTSTLEGVRRLSLDERRPSLDGAGHDAYPYREIEYAYTYGRPPADSPAAGFLAFATRGPGQDAVRTHGHPPCGTPEGLRVCGAAD